MKDGGKRVTYGKGGAQREPHRGKGRYDWISPFALRRMAFWMEAGGIKYGSRNWEKGMPYEHPMDSLMRHTNDYRRGDRTEDHLAAIAVNAFFLMHYQDTGKDAEFDTLPSYPEANTPEQDAINKARLCKIPEEIPEKPAVDTAALRRGIEKVLHYSMPALCADELQAFSRLFEESQPPRSPSEDFVRAGIGRQCADGIRAGMRAATSPSVAAAMERLARDAAAAVRAARPNTHEDEAVKRYGYSAEESTVDQLLQALERPIARRHSDATMIDLRKRELAGALSQAALRDLDEERAIIKVNHHASNVARYLRRGMPLDFPPVRVQLQMLEQAALEAHALPHLKYTRNVLADNFRSVMSATAVLAHRALGTPAIVPDRIDHKGIMPESIGTGPITDEQITMRSAWSGSDPEHPPVVGTIDGEEWFGVPRSQYYRMKDATMHSDGVSALHDCNDCPDKKDCAYVPEPGAWVRINCPLHPSVNSRRAPRTQTSGEGAWSRV